MKRLLLALSLSIATPAMAAEPQSTSVVDPLAIAAADRLLTAMDYDRMMERTVEQMIPQLGPALKKSIETELGEPVDDELIRRLQEVQASFMRATLIDDPNLRRATGLVYARHFTAADLDRLATLYKDPVMRKWTEVAPALMGDTMPLIFDMIAEHRDELKERFKKIVTDYLAEKQKVGGA